MRCAAEACPKVIGLTISLQHLQELQPMQAELQTAALGSGAELLTMLLGPLEGRLQIMPLHLQGTQLFCLASSHDVMSSNIIQAAV